jgi:hypothetical protein
MEMHHTNNLVMNKLIWQVGGLEYKEEDVENVSKEHSL